MRILRLLLNWKLYQVFIDDVSTGTMTTNLGGKLSFSVELDANTKAEVKIVKC